MDIFSWSIDLTWAFVGASAGLILDKLFDKRMSLISTVSLGVFSLFLGIFPFSGLGPELQKHYVDVLTGCFTGSLVSLLWRRFQTTPDAHTVLFVAFFLSILIFAAYGFIFIIRVFRYYYGLGPSFPLMDLLLIIFVSSMITLGIGRISIGLITIPIFLKIAWIMLLNMSKQIIFLYICFEIIGLFFIKSFSMSWLLTFVAFLLFIVISLIDSVSRLQFTMHDATLDVTTQVG